MVSNNSILPFQIPKESKMWTHQKKP